MEPPPGHREEGCVKSRIMKLKGENLNGRNAGKIPEKSLTISWKLYTRARRIGMRKFYIAYYENRGQYEGSIIRRGREGRWLLQT